MFEVPIARGDPSALIDIERNLYPYCIVWTSLPCITIVVPLIGHTGVGDSDGVITDFAASYTIGRKRLVFGPVKRYWFLDLNEEQRAQWNTIIQEVNLLFSKRRHCLFTNNCHHHVGEILNRLNYQNASNWGAIKVCYHVWLKGHWKSAPAAASVLSPFLIVIAVIIGVILLSVYL